MVKADHNVVQIHFLIIVGFNLLAILGLLSGLHWWLLWRLGILGGFLEYLCWLILRNLGMRLSCLSLFKLLVMVAHNGLGHVALLAGMVGTGPWLLLQSSLLSAIDLHLDLVLVGLTQHGWSLFFVDVRAQDLRSSLIANVLLWLALDLQFLIGLAWLLRLRCTELC